MRILILLSCLLLGVAALRPALADEEKLAGGQWRLAGEGGAHGPRLRFDAGRVSGSGGCNRFGGRYSQEGDALSFSPLAATRMACAPDVMQRERTFFTMLAKVRKLQLSGDALKLLDETGGTLAAFTREEAE